MAESHSPIPSSGDEEDAPEGISLADSKTVALRQRQKETDAVKSVLTEKKRKAREKQEKHKGEKDAKVSKKFQRIPDEILNALPDDRDTESAKVAAVPVEKEEKSARDGKNYKKPQSNKQTEVLDSGNTSRSKGLTGDKDPRPGKRKDKAGKNSRQHFNGNQTFRSSKASMASDSTPLNSGNTNKPKYIIAGNKPQVGKSKDKAAKDFLRKHFYGKRLARSTKGVFNTSKSFNAYGTSVRYMSNEYKNSSRL